jgi:hypothetical protein
MLSKLSKKTFKKCFSYKKSSFVWLDQTIKNQTFVFLANNIFDCQQEHIE